MFNLSFNKLRKCDVTAMSHVAEVSHTIAIAIVTANANANANVNAIAIANANANANAIAVAAMSGKSGDLD